MKKTVILAMAIAGAFALYASETEKPDTHQDKATSKQGICNAVPYCTTGSTNDYCTPCGYTEVDCSDGYSNWKETVQKYCNQAP